eukprot:XP_011660821.1 PREDICTED: neurotrypsin-like [Strongylocentrotus purpuratus]
MEYNNIVEIYNGAFHGLPSLENLYLNDNDITMITEDVFSGTVDVLHIENNRIRMIENRSLYGLDIHRLRLQNNNLVTLSGIFDGLPELERLSTSDNRLCCLLDQRENVTCARTSPTSPLETCGRLYPSVVLRIAGWVIGLTSLIGNLTVLVLRLRQEQQLTVQTLLIMNLAVADCLMERNVRLVDFYDKNQVSKGFVLVYINGTWGTICNQAWGRADSEVTCFELGFSGAVLTDHGSYKPHPDNILYDVRCVGNETSILDCPSSDVDEGGDCWAPSKAYAFCTNYTIRLTEAHFPGGGRVEVFYLGSWRPVCSDHWDLSGGHVACGELGLGTALDVDHSFISLEEMEGYILNDVRCNGSESRILDCLGSTFSIGKCNSTRSARVRCSDGVRLVGGRNSSEGRVEFFSKSTWGTVCAESWTLNDAHVVCKSLGFAGALKAFTELELGYGSNNVYLEDARCTGRETNILNCPNAQFGVIDFCFFGNDGAGVLCSSEGN